MPQSFYTPYGFRDHLSDEASQRRSLQNHLQNLFLQYGYSIVETPMVEYMELYDSRRGSVSPKDMYRFVDRDGDMLVLRPDMTPALARMASFYYKEKSLPIRVTSSGSTFRYNTRYSAKQRQLFQSGIELYGFGHADEDAEVLLIAIQSLRTLKLSDFRMTIGHAGLIRDLLDELHVPPQEHSAWASHFESKNEFALKQDAVRLNMTEDQWDLIKMMTEIGDSELLLEAHRIAETLGLKKTHKDLAWLMEVDRQLSFYSVGKEIIYDPGMQPELSYYTGMIFKGYAYGSATPLMDGGRYDALIEQMHPGWAAVGFGIYQDSVLQAMKAQQRLPEKVHFVLAFIDPDMIQKGTSLIEQLRGQGIPVIRMVSETISEADSLEYAKDHDVSVILSIHTDACVIETLDKNVSIQTDMDNVMKSIMELYPAERRLSLL